MANEHLAAEAVASKVLGLAAEIADQGKTVSAESVLRDLGFDDLSAIELVMSIEDDLEIDIDVSEYDNAPEAFLSLTLQALIDAALRAVAKNPAAALPSARISHKELENAPKLTPADIEAVIVGEQYFTAEHGINGAMVRGQLHGAVKSSVHMGSLAHVTYCVLLLRNGAKVTGINHGPVSAANFDAAKGREYARENAIEKVWELEGYALRERLMASPVTLNLSEEQGRELMETLKSLKPCDLVPGGQATDGGPNPHYDPDADKGAQLLDIMRAFVDLYRVSCPETIHQTDRVIEKAGGLIEKLCDVAGYYRDPDDEAEEAQP